ncbi:MAG: HD domain-containing phosphohydrolase [Pseudomonadota bacterium]
MSKISLSGILASLSHALDLTEGQPEGHCVRCCHIGMAIGREAGLDDAELADLYYTLLLKDLGCSTNAARICSLYLTDDRAFKRDFKRVDGSLSQALRFILNNTGMQANMAQRFGAIYKVLKDGGQISRSLIESRCQRGAQIALKMRFNQNVADAISSLDEHWDGTGQPEKLHGSAIPRLSQIALMAQVTDVFNINAGKQSAIDEIEARSGSWFDPELVATFRAATKKAEFWEQLRAEDLQHNIFALEPGELRRTVDENYLDDIADAFSQVVDAKSPYTAGHSRRVATFADMIATEIGYTEEQRRWLHRASLLHDIGKLGVSNAILDKPGKLEHEEFAAIKMHPVYSHQILDQIELFGDIASIARGHHEKLNGKGYPDALAGCDIGMDTRIVTVADIFDALTAERPYRGPMPEEQALSIMEETVGTEIDGECFSALKSVLANFNKQAA